MIDVLPVIPLPSLFDDYERDRGVGDIFVSNFVDAPSIQLPSRIDVRVVEADRPFVDVPKHSEWVSDWDSYVGQKLVKEEIQVNIDKTFIDCTVLPHILLAASMPGVGKTTLARLIAKELNARCATLVAPFSLQAFQEAMLSLKTGDILFIDEIHKMADNGKAFVENLLTVLEENYLQIDGRMVELPEFTLIGATTDADMLPETILDRFEIKPVFEPYSSADMVRIVKNFCNGLGVVLPPEVMVTIALASRSTPRVSRELVKSAATLQTVWGSVTSESLLRFKGYEANGVTRQHKAYLTTVLNHGRRVNKDSSVEYRMGESTLSALLRESGKGIARTERYLMEIGMLERTTRGRVLTDSGIAAAKRYSKEN